MTARRGETHRRARFPGACTTLFEVWLSEVWRYAFHGSTLARSRASRMMALR
jgi:hypothetical protein